jgi:C-terminal processing protease CtpA/Prc
LRIRTLVRSLRASLVFIFPLVAACDNSGGSGFAGTPPPSGEWQEGVFLDAATFVNRCQNPRSGIDPATNQPYLDVQGTTLDENNFLRSYSNDTYLWYDEIIDQDPGLFADPVAYFLDELITPVKDKDRFHFTEDTEEYFQLSQSGVSVGYGAAWALLSDTPPREVFVAYTEPNSSATNLPDPLLRGAMLVTVDGIDVENGVDRDALNAGLFPTEAGQTHIFEILDPGAQTTRTIQMTSTEVTAAPVRNVSIIPTATGPVGYLLFNDHIRTAESALVDAVNQLNAGPGITDLVLDIRYNGGGFLFIASQLAYMIAGDAQIAGRPFETLQFNDKHPVTNPVTGEALAPTPFFNVTTTNELLPVLNLPQRRVFVLTGPGTCSASESIVNSLRGVDVDVIQIGTTTCGKPYGFYETPNCGTSYFTIQFQGINAKGFGDYTDGFSPADTDPSIGTILPGCSVGDDFSNALGDPAEARLATALAYRDTGACPPPASLAMRELGEMSTGTTPRDGTVVKNPWLTNRIVERPR